MVIHSCSIFAQSLTSDLRLFCSEEQDGDRSRKHRTISEHSLQEDDVIFDYFIDYTSPTIGDGKHKPMVF